MLQDIETAYSIMQIKAESTTHKVISCKKPTNNPNKHNYHIELDGKYASAVKSN